MGKIKNGDKEVKTLPWYPRDMGKYARDTGTLNLAQHGAYNLLLDYYYSTGPIDAFEQCSSNAQAMLPEMPNHSPLYILCKAITKADQDAVDFILKKYFTLEKGFYRHQKADGIIKEQSEKHANRVAAGKAGGKKKTSSNAQAMPKQCSSNTPQTKNQNQTKIDKIKEDSENEFSEDDFIRQHFDIDKVLSDKARHAAKENAPQWDMQELYSIFNDGIRSKKLNIPDKPDAAFPAWCKKITKGKPPK